MKRINVKVVIKAEILSLLIFAVVLSFAGRTEIVKAIITAGIFVIVVPSVFLAAYSRKKTKSGKSIAGSMLFFLSYYLVVREHIYYSMGTYGDSGVCAYRRSLDKAR